MAGPVRHPRPGWGRPECGSRDGQVSSGFRTVRFRTFVRFIGGGPAGRVRAWGLATTAGIASSRNAPDITQSSDGGMESICLRFSYRRWTHRSAVGLVWKQGYRFYALGRKSDSFVRTQDLPKWGEKTSCLGCYVCLCRALESSRLERGCARTGTRTRARLGSAGYFDGEAGEDRKRDVAPGVRLLQILHVYLWPIAGRSAGGGRQHTGKEAGPAVSARSAERRPRRRYEDDEWQDGREVLQRLQTAQLRLR